MDEMMIDRLIVELLTVINFTFLSDQETMFDSD